MGHYAFINEENIVVEVITGRDEGETVDGISDWEEYYSNRRKGLRALRTSYNTFAGEHKANGVPFRKNYAGVGYSYDETLDAFIPPKPFDSWVLNQATCLWEPPISHPNDGLRYKWDEEAGDWVEVVEPVI